MKILFKQQSLSSACGWILTLGLVLVSQAAIAQTVTFNEDAFGPATIIATEAAPSPAPVVSNMIDIWHATNMTAGTDGIMDAQLTMVAGLFNPNVINGCNDADFEVGAGIGGSGQPVSGASSTSDFGGSTNDDCVCESGYACYQVTFLNGFNSDAGSFNVALTSSNGRTEGHEAMFAWITGGTDQNGNALTLPSANLGDLANFCEPEYNTPTPVSSHLGLSGPGFFAVDQNTGITNCCAADPCTPTSGEGGEDTESGENPGDNTNAQAENDDWGLDATDIVTSFNLCWILTNAPGTDCDGDGDTGVNTNPSASLSSITARPAIVCELDVTYGGDVNNPVSIGSFDCNATIPEFTLPITEAQLEAAPYSAVIDDGFCAGINDPNSGLFITSSDSTTPSFCGANNSTIIRTIVVLDDQNDNDQLDPGEQDTTLYFSYTVEVDDEGPSVTMPDNVVGLECDDALPAGANSGTEFLALASSVNTPALSDNCTVGLDNIDVSFSDDISLPPNDWCSGFTITRTYTFSDSCFGSNGLTRNQTLADQTFSYVADIIGPVVTCPDPVTLTCLQDLPAGETTIAGFLLLTNADANDVCTLQDDLTVNFVDNTTPPTDRCTEIMITRTYTIADECGNGTECTQVFTFEADVTPPSIGCSPGITDLTCADAPDFATNFAPDISTVTSVDACGEPAIVTWEGDDFDPTSFSFCAIDGPFVVTRTYLAVDNCGNSPGNTCTQTFTFLPDTDPPTISCPAAITVTCADDTSLDALGNATATDNCTADGDIVITNSDASTQLGPGCGLVDFVITRTFTATDNCGNATNCVQLITVIPAGDFSCNNHVNVTIGEDCSISLNPAMFISGIACFLQYSLSFTDADNNPIDEADLLDWLGIDIKVITTDNCSGVSCWGWLTLEDKTPPRFPECDEFTGFLPDTTITCEEFVEGLNPLFPLVEGADCDTQLDSLVLSDTLGLNCALNYATVIRRQYRVQDQYNNVSICFQNINVLKKDIDDIEFPKDTVVMLSEAGTCDIFNEEYCSPEYLGAPSCLDCPNIKFHYHDTHVPLQCETNKKFVRSWLVLDWCTGDSREMGQLIEVLDDLIPLKICPPDTLTFEAKGGNCYASPVLDPFGIDNGFGAAIFDDCSHPITIEVAYLPAIPGTNIPQDGPFIVVESISEDAAKTVQLPNLELGFTWMRYRFTDACGNSFPLLPPGNVGTDDPSSCFFEVEIVDGNPPTAWCEGFDVVALDQDGYAVVTAESVDDNSEDPCGQELTYEVRRIDGNCPGHSSDRNFGPDIHMCCNDLGKSITVELRVTDTDGNSSTCLSELSVSFDPGPIDVTCPDNITIECTEDYTDPAVVGTATVENTGLDADCFSGINIENEEFNTEDLNDCGYGTVIRTFDVTDDIGNLLEQCVQVITIEDDGGLKEVEIDWPALEVTIDACGDDPYDHHGIEKPEVDSDAECISVSITKEDGPIRTPPYGSGYCAYFYRTWYVTDWCTHTDLNPDGVVFTFEQTVFINDGSKPEFISTCEDVSVNASNHECEAFVPLIVFVEDACDDFANISITWSIDVYNDGDAGNDLSGTGPDASDTYPAGTHKITFVATDGCGNESDMCMYKFTVVGDQNPTPICYADIIWSMDIDGETVVWASDFDIKSTNGCGTDNELIFSFTADGLTPSLTFTCDDIPNNIGVSIPLEVFVIDAGTGIFESCIVVLELQDNKDACPDGPNNMSRVSGMVMNPTHEGVSSFEVMLENMSDYSMSMEMTDTDGTYAFNSVAYYNEYKVEPRNNADPLNGVSTLDLVYIQKHILGLSQLDTPYKLIAADVNDSQDVSSIDLIELRKLILGVYEEYPNNDSWVFVPGDHEFADPQIPYDYPRGIFLDDLYTSARDVNFIAVKVGDVNSSVEYGFRGESVEGRSSDLQLVMMPSENVEGDLQRYDLVINEDASLLGMQFSFEFDASAMIFEGISAGALDMKQENYAEIAEAAGVITVSYHELNATELHKGDVLMRLAFDQIDQSNSDFTISSDITLAEAYTASEEIKGIELIVSRIDHEVGEFELYQNQPNPFSDQTSVSFYTPEDGNVSLEILDANGKLLYEAADQFAVGYHSFKVDTRDLSSSGVLIYRVQTKEASLTKKMIVVK